jgi:hypothetical protein
MGPKKSCNPKSFGNLQAGKFLKYLIKTEQSSYQGSRVKRSLVTLVTFFCLIMEKQTTKPALRSLRLGIIKNFVFLVIKLVIYSILGCGEFDE